MIIGKMYKTKISPMLMGNQLVEWCDCIKGVQTLRTQDTLDPGHFGTSAELSARHFGTGAKCLEGSKCLGSEVSVHHIKYLGVYLVSRSDIKFDINPVKRCFYAVCNYFHIVVDWTK